MPHLPSGPPTPCVDLSALWHMSHVNLGVPRPVSPALPICPCTVVSAFTTAAALHRRVTTVSDCARSLLSLSVSPAHANVRAALYCGTCSRSTLSLSRSLSLPLHTPFSPSLLLSGVRCTCSAQAPGAFSSWPYVTNDLSSYFASAGTVVIAIEAMHSRGATALMQLQLRLPGGKVVTAGTDASWSAFNADVCKLLNRHPPTLYTMVDPTQLNTSQPTPPQPDPIPTQLRSNCPPRRPCRTVRSLAPVDLQSSVSRRRFDRVFVNLVGRWCA